MPSGRATALGSRSRSHPSPSHRRASPGVGLFERARARNRSIRRRRNWPGRAPPPSVPGTDDTGLFFEDAASVLDWTVDPRFLPSGWFVDFGEYRRAGGGRLEIAYRGPGGARCRATTRVPSARMLPVASPAAPMPAARRSATMEHPIATDDGGWGTRGRPRRADQLARRRQRHGRGFVPRDHGGACGRRRLGEGGSPPGSPRRRLFAWRLRCPRVIPVGPNPTTGIADARTPIAAGGLESETIGFRVRHGPPPLASRQSMSKAM